MSNTLLRESHEFDCSAWLGHGLQWPVNEPQNQCDLSKSSIDVGERYSQYTERKTESCVDWGVLLKEEMNAVKQKENGMLLRREISPTFEEEKPAEQFVEKQYYESEYNTLVKWMEQEDIIVPPPSMFADKREEIQRISRVADEALGRESSYVNSYYYDNEGPGYMCGDLAAQDAIETIDPQKPPGREVQHTNLPNYDYQDPSVNFEDLAKEVAIKAIETTRTSIVSPGDFKNFVEEQLIGFGEETKEKDSDLRKRRLCRHFVKGFCLRGDSCEFLHDPSIFCTDEQKVFLGGLPLHMTSAILKAKLEEQGITVLNKPRIMRGFTPQVCIGSVEQAERLIATRFLNIDDHRVDVRPYQDREQLRQGLPSIVKRSVFLGGLPEDTTGEIIVEDLQRLDVKVVNFPVVKNGYAPRVVLGTLEHAKMLVALKRVMVNGTAVDVRPYVNFRKRY